MFQKDSAFSKIIWKNSVCLRAKLPAEIAKWLLYSSSFTEKLERFYAKMGVMKIHILSERAEIAKKHTLEFSQFKCHAIYSREIQILVDNNLIMFARSVIPKDILPIYKRLFRGLGQQPLGHMLFLPSIKRSQFEMAKIFPGNREFFLSTTVDTRDVPFLWSRRSVFSTTENLVVLSEVFSPYFIQLISKQDG
jgi:chorismate-pyruvate lyase